VALVTWPPPGYAPDYTPLPHICYHVEFDSSASKGVCINRREPPNWGALEPAPILTPRNTFLVHVLSGRIWSLVRWY